MQIETEPEGKPKYKVSQAALLVAVGGILSLLAGLACQVLYAYLFGAGAEMDAFFTALTIPLYLQIVLLGGLPFVVIPAFVHEQTSGNEEDAWSLVGTFIWITVGVLLTVSIIGVIFSNQIIAATAPGFGLEKTKLAGQMLAIMMLSVPFLGLSSFTSGVENVRERFFWPAAATAVGSVGNLITLLLLNPSIGVMALPYGNLVSSILQACITTIPVIKHGWKKTIALSDPRLLEMLKLISPFIIFGAITSSRIIFERFFASALPNGQLSYIGYANKISNIFVVLFAASVASAIFPSMARAFSRHGIDGFLEETDYGFRLTFALALPSLCILSVAAYPLVKTFFERGAFVESTTAAVTILIPIAMLNDVVLRMVNNMVSRTFFVLKDTFTTNLISSLTLILYIYLAKVLTERFGYVGLAIAQPIHFGLAQVIMFIFLGRKIHFSFIGKLAISSLKILLVSAAAALASWVVLLLTGSLPSILQLVLCLPIGSIVYIILLNVVDQEMALAVLDMTGISRLFPLNRSKIFLFLPARHPNSGQQGKSGDLP